MYPYPNPIPTTPPMQPITRQSVYTAQQSVPVQGMPMQGVPSQGMPMQGVPSQGMPMQGVPSQGMPMQGVPQGMQDGLQEYIYPANLPEALRLIAGAVAGEREDRLFYEYLIETAPTDEDKAIIRSIRDDEMRHFELFRIIYFQLTGQVLPPPAPMPFATPASYCAGLRKALLGEENAVVRYRKILFAMQNRVHINMLVEIITDELRHGTLFSYLYAENRCKV